jgi:hypothetical protein
LGQAGFEHYEISVIQLFGKTFKEEDGCSLFFVIAAREHKISDR